MTFFSTERKKVYLCYCENDKDLFLERLQTHLKPLEKQCSIEIWSQRNIKVGTNRLQEIDYAIQTTRIAILLVSAYFWASEDIQQKELPLLLQAWSDKEIDIIPIHLSVCDYEYSPLKELQFANPQKPLDDMPISDVNKLWKDVVTLIREMLNTSSTPSPYLAALEQKKKEIINKPAYLDLLRELSNQTLPNSERVTIALNLAEVALIANEAEKQSLRGRLHTLRLDENSELVEGYITLILGLLDDVTESYDVQKSYLKLDKNLPPHLQKAIEEYLNQQGNKNS